MQSLASQHHVRHKTAKVSFSHLTAQNIILNSHLLLEMVQPALYSKIINLTCISLYSWNRSRKQKIRSYKTCC